MASVRFTLIFLAVLATWIPASGEQQKSRIPKRARIVLPDAAFVGMPIWMRVESADGRAVHYPLNTVPNDFDCYEIQVKQGGRLIPAAKGHSAAGHSGGFCGFIADGISNSKLPLHLQFPSLQPGTYQVKYLRRDYFPREGVKIAEESDWTRLRVRAAPAQQVQQWLDEGIKTLPETPAKLIGEALPSLLASRDVRVLRLMLELTYHSDQLVAGYAANSLLLFPSSDVRDEVSAKVAERGLNDALTGSIYQSKDLLLPTAHQLIDVAIDQLRSRDTSKLQAAVHVLSLLRDPRVGLPPDLSDRAGGALLGSVDYVLEERNEPAAGEIAQFLGSTNAPGARVILWRFVDAKLAVEQSLICLTWLHDRNDLRRITDYLREDDPADEHGSRASSVVEHFADYGPASQPFLRELLKSSTRAFVKTAAAKGLTDHFNDEGGWQFFLNTMIEKPFYRDEMCRWLQERFPELRGSDDAAIVGFLQRKISQARASRP